MESLCRRYPTSGSGKTKVRNPASTIRLIKSYSSACLNWLRKPPIERKASFLKRIVELIIINISFSDTDRMNASYVVGPIAARPKRFPVELIWYAYAPIKSILCLEANNSSICRFNLSGNQMSSASKRPTQWHLDSLTPRLKASQCPVLG